MRKPSLEDVADVLDNAHRYGEDEDKPEGVRWIQITDTLANQMSACIREYSGKSNPMKKYLFLDLTGVLVTHRERNLGFILDDYYRFNKNCVECLESIVKATSCVIIVISSVRRGDLGYLHEMFKDRGFAYYASIVGETPRAQTFFKDTESRFPLWVPRGCEIKNWIDEHIEFPMDFQARVGVDYQYVIIDNNGKEILPEQQPHLIQTNTDYGLNPSLAEKAINILNAKDVAASSR